MKGDDNMKNPYGFIISNGVNKDKLNTSRTYLIFADNKDKAYEFCYPYVNKKIKEDKYVDDNGNEINHWWKAYNIEEVDIPQIDVANVIVI